MFAVRGIRCTVSGAWYMACGVRCTVHGGRCAVRGARYTVYSVRCMVCALRWTVYGVRCAVHGIRCTVHVVWCMMYGVRRAVHGVRCAVHGVLCTVRGARYTASFTKRFAAKVVWTLRRVLRFVYAFWRGRARRAFTIVERRVTYRIDSNIATHRFHQRVPWGGGN